jgi:uncharacterized membrane protein
MTATHTEGNGLYARTASSASRKAATVERVSSSSSHLPLNQLDRIGRRARGLGWFSIGLGLMELLAPRSLARRIGVARGRRNRLLMRALGAREILSGIGLLTSRRTAPWLWSRVAGDAMDIALLTGAYAGSRLRGRDSSRLSMALTSVAGVAALDIFTSWQMSGVERDGARPAAGRPVRILSSITVNCPVDQVYAFWRDFENLPAFMTNVESVQILDPLRSRWSVTIAGKTLQWDARITADQPNQSIAWQTLNGSEVVHSGEVRFVPAPGERGTEVHVAMQVSPPGGALGRAATKLGRMVPKEQITNDLRRLKQGLEVGEVTRSDASIHDGPHPARPSGRKTPMPGTTTLRGTK